MLEQALKYEKERNEELQKRLQTQEQQIFELLATIKDLSQGIKRLEAPQNTTTPTPRKKFLGIF